MMSGFETASRWWRTLMTLIMTAPVVTACSDRVAAGGASAEISLTEELRIGGVDGALEYTFGNIAGVALAPDSSVYVADRQGPVVRHYDREGRHLGDLERPGQGPGEFSSVDGIGVSAAGELGIYDGRNARISWFSSSGEYLESYPITGAFGSFRAFVTAPDGASYLRMLPESGFSESIDDGLAADWARVDRDGTVERLFADVREQRVGPRYVVSGRGGMYRPFVTMNLSAIGPDGTFYTARNDEYRITHRHPSGVETTIVRDEPPIAVSSDEKREWEGFSEMAASRPGTDRSDYFPIPDTKPFLRELVVDADGRLWASRYTEASFMEYSEWERNDRAEKGRPSYQWRDLLRWDLFGPNDDYLGTVTLPFKTTFVTAVGDEIWGIQAGDYNEEYVVRWRMSASR